MDGGRPAGLRPDSEFVRWVVATMGQKRPPLSGRELARRMGVSHTTVNALLSGANRTTPGTLEKLAAVLEVPYEQVRAFYAASVRAADAVSTPAPDDGSVRRLAQAGRDRNDPIWVPLVENPASAGGGSPGELGFLPLFPPYSERGDEWSAVLVQGHCLEPRLMHGHRAFVNMQATPRPGDIVLAVHGGEALFKVYEPGDGYVILNTLDDTPAIRADETTRILGVVREAHYRP